MRIPGTMVVEVSSDSTIWQCDQCGDRQEVAKNGDWPSAPAGWWRTAEMILALAAVDNGKEFCSRKCLSEWAAQEVSVGA